MAAKKSRWSGTFFVLFGIPFFAGGCAVGYFELKMVADYWRARGWIETPAKILSVNLEHHSGSKSTTYLAVCTYTYTFNGKKYTGTRVGLSGSSADNLGSWQQRTYERLHAAPNHRTTCYVNPVHPEQALLDRDLRFPLICLMSVFPLLFCSLGGGILLSGWRELRRRRAEGVRLEQYPDAPWMDRQDWADGIIYSNVSRVAAGLWILAVYWVLMTAPILALLPRELFVNRNYLSLIGLILPGIGILLLATAIWWALEKRRFGRTHLRLNTFPGAVGGHLRGELVLVGGLAGLNEVEAVLSCVNTYTTRSGGKSSQSERTLFSLTRHLGPVSVVFGETEVRLPFDFEIPGRCRPCDRSNPADWVEWSLKAEASVPGVDLKLKFDVPVYGSTSEDPEVEAVPALTEEEQAAIASSQPPEGSRIMCAPEPSGSTRFDLPCWPGISMFLVLFVVACLFSAVPVLPFTPIAPKEWFFCLFAAVFGLVALFLWTAILSFFGSAGITVGADGISAERRIGPFARRRQVAAADVEEITYKESASSGSRKWYRVTVSTSAGRKVTLASMVRSELAARWLVRAIEERLTSRSS